MGDVALYDLLRQRTHARVGLGRAGDGLPTQELLAFQGAHAMARDAVHGQVDFAAIAARLAPWPALSVRSAAADRSSYLRRPDLGRQLADGAAAVLPHGPWDLVVVIADGLSSRAVERHGAATARAVIAALADFNIAPVVLAAQGRVAIGDDIAAAMGARMALVLIGERPGLSTADSLGAYLTFGAAPGARDHQRNCVSNIHAQGLAPEAAAAKIAWLARAALRLGLTGVDLKEAAPDAALTSVASSLLEG